MVLFQIRLAIFEDMIDGQGTIFCRVTNMGSEAWIPFGSSLDFFHEQRLLRMAHRVVKIHVMRKIAVHIADKGQERCESNPAREPDLFLSTRFLVKHAIRALDHSVRVGFQVVEKITSEIPAGFDGDA